MNFEKDNCKVCEIESEEDNLEWMSSVKRNVCLFGMFGFMIFNSVKVSRNNCG